MMMDNDWLMTTAIEKRCVLQYTGVENVSEVQNIVRKLKAAGSSAYETLWGENAGYEVAGRNPTWLAQVITHYGLRGIDFTWSNWLFGKDGVTPSETFKEFAYSVRMIRTFYTTGERLPPLSPADAVRRTGPRSWTLECVASTRLLGSFPDAIQGGDPEIAALEGGQTQRILLRFPLGALPKGYIIRHARLVLKRYLDYGDDHSPAKLAVYRVTQPWTEIGASWKESMPGIPWERSGGIAVDCEGRVFAPGVKTIPWACAEVPPYKAAGDSVEWDVTKLAGKLAEGPDYGLMIAVVGQENTNKSFASRRHPDRQMCPVLKVEAAAPDP
jgi:hypothetical protein